MSVAGFDVATAILREVEARTRTEHGISRPSYGEGETAAIDIIRGRAESLGLTTESDFARNLYVTLKGRDPSLPRLIVGSHVDAVPNGGNFDGLAGVAAALGVVVELQNRDVRPIRTISAMAIRAEENAWFGAQHVGSRSALGLLSPSLLDRARRIDTGLPLGAHMQHVGADLDPIRRQQPFLTSHDVAAYLELHIEQGPVLTSRDSPAGIVSAIRGSTRCMEVKCLGAYGHSGAVPMALRNDAVAATARLVTATLDYADEVNSSGGDLVVTFGRFFTDPQAHGLTTIPGEVTFSVDFRSLERSILEDAERRFIQASEQIGRRHNVAWRRGEFQFTAPTVLDRTLRSSLTAACIRAGIEPFELASGAGHDAQDFLEAGIPAAMLFVRNDNGSHNPNELMSLSDYRAAFSVLVDACSTLTSRSDRSPVGDVQ